MARSDIWRSKEYADMVRETAYVTRGISDYFGSAARDRSYGVTWGPIANTYGGTDTKSKRVILNPKLLFDKCPVAPFTGDAVDLMQGVAAHEAGHAIIAKVEYREGKKIEDGMVGNIVEDMMIDGPAFRHHNPGLAVLTAALRVDMAHDEVPAIEEYWTNGPEKMAAQQLLNIWGCARLFNHTLTPTQRRAHEVPFIQRLDVVADTLYHATDFGGYVGVELRRQAVKDINDILREYADVTPQPKPEDESGEGEQGDEGEEGEEGSESDAPSISSGQSDFEKDDNDDKQKSSGSGDADEEEDEEEDDSNSDSSDSDEDEDADEDSDSSGEGDEDSDDEGDEAGDSDSDSDSSDSDGDDAPAPDTQGGKASKAKTKLDWDATLPEVCPGFDTDGSEPRTVADGLTRDEVDFWKDVVKELERLDIANPTLVGKVYLDKYTDKKTVAGIKSAYAALASEPTRQRHHDSGRVDRRRLSQAMFTDDVFTRQRERVLDGRVVVVVDLSGSTSGVVGLIKQAAASVYEALRTTDLECWVYSYGSPNVAKLAEPKQVFPIFERIGAGGGTPTAQALLAVNDEVKTKHGGSNVVIHVTDGMPASQSEAQAAMAALRKSGWKLVNIGVGHGVDLSVNYGKFSDSTQHIDDYKKLPRLLSAAIKDIVAGHKRKVSV